jgi:multiple antibiotic resistance protein
MAFFLKALAALFTIIDPIGLVPVVIALTSGMSGRARFITITRAALIAGIVIAVFGAFGQQIFDALGVTAQAFSIAGGVLLFLVAIDMLFGRPSGARETPREAREARSEARRNEDISVFPLAIPLIAGPGTITTIILLVGASKSDPVQLASVALAAIITLVAAWLAMMLSAQIQKRIGVTGILVVSRVLGMLLAAVAAQFILNGVGGFLQHSATTGLVR